MNLDSRKAPGCCNIQSSSAIASVGSGTHNVIQIVRFHPAFLWCWYAIVCRPTWSQCPKNIFMDFIWPSSKLGTFEEFLDWIKNPTGQQWLSALHPLIGLTLISGVQTSWDSVWRTVSVSLSFADKVTSILENDRLKTFCTVARNAGESIVQSTKGSWEM